jgi:hypothetical protein
VIIQEAKTMGVEVEEIVATCAPPNNGAGPTWCYGAPLVARLGDTVFVSAMETGADVPLLCNTRPRLFRRAPRGGWELYWTPEKFREREPCPFVAFPGGGLFLTVNPSLTPPGTKYGACDPHLLRFDPAKTPAAPVLCRPPWPSDVAFTDHSYRGVGADRTRREILPLNIDAKAGHYHYALCDARLHWTKPGILRFPLRACYPQVCLRDRAAHVLAIGDIVEPVEEWRRYKREKTGQEWDYVFRRLFYAWTPDVAAKPFSEPVEVDTVDATGGHILNLDMGLAPDGEAHLLYVRQKTTPLLREKYFPDIPLRASLEHVVMKGGQVVRRATLMEGGEGLAGGLWPQWARFHSPDGRRLLVVYARIVAAPGGQKRENGILPLLPAAGEPQPLALSEPFTAFFTATERGGSAPSKTLDLFGLGADGTKMRYARVGL